MNKRRGVRICCKNFYLKNTLKGRRVKIKNRLRIFTIKKFFNRRRRRSGSSGGRDRVSKAAVKRSNFLFRMRRGVKNFLKSKSLMYKVLKKRYYAFRKLNFLLYHVLFRHH